MKTALVHDWLITLSGAEKVLQAIHDLYPSSIYTLVKGTIFQDRQIQTSFIQNLPFSKKFYRYYLPLFPMAIESFDLSHYDLVISTSHAVAKGVIIHPHQTHICYCHTPMRYIWDQFHYYPVKSFITKLFFHYLRLWDVTSSHRVDHFIANSHFVARRIRKYYGRDAHVIYPPVDVDRIPFEEKKEDFYLTASRFVPYKKIDLIVEAFSHMPEKKLLVIGDGPEKRKIYAKAKKNIEILEKVSDEKLYYYLGKAKAFVFAAIEDFGILPVEAQAAGTPVIALEKGGVCETVIAEKTGIFFKEQTSKAIIDAVQRFKQSFSPEQLRAHALQFSTEKFKERFKHFVDENSHLSRR